jgi:MFS family permease
VIQVFYSVGYAGMTFAIDVITLDTSTLRNRGLAYAFTSSPNIIVAYAGPNVAQKFYEKNWRWAFGAFAIILPVFAAPMVWVLLHAKGEAKKKGLLQPKVPSGRTFMQNVSHYAVEFDGKLNPASRIQLSRRWPGADSSEQSLVPSF